LFYFPTFCLGRFFGGTIFSSFCFEDLEGAAFFSIVFYVDTGGIITTFLPSSAEVIYTI